MARAIVAGAGVPRSRISRRVERPEWEALAEDFEAVLDKYGVSEAEQKEPFAMVGSTRAWWSSNRVGRPEAGPILQKRR